LDARHPYLLVQWYPRSGGAYAACATAAAEPPRAIVMSAAPEPEIARTEATDVPAVIQLPDQSPPAKKRPKRQRRHVDHFRTDDAEHAELAARAREVELSVDAYCRLMTLGDAGARSRRTQPTVDSRLRAQQITAINRAGNLVNQGIRALHEIRQAAAETTGRDRLADEMEAARALLEGAIPPLMEALATVLGDDR
jgi:hypothetical protein